MKKNEDYNKGVESGLKVAKAYVEKEKKAMDYLTSKIDLIGEGHDEMKTAVNHLIEDSDENCIGRIFGICNTIKPKELKDHEQKVLISILATLGTQHMNDDQRVFFNNLRHHLNIEGYEPDNSYDFKKIGSLEAVSSIKTIAKAVRIFLFLDEGNMDGIYKHEDDLFSHFELRSFDEMDAMIETIHCLFGKDGLIEFYGDFEIVGDVDKNNNEISTDEELKPLEEYTISSMLVVPRGTEDEIKNKIIHLKAFIKCDGSLMIDNCVLFYNESDSFYNISLEERSRLSIHNTVIICKGYNEKPFISGRETDLSFENTSFINCVNFLDISLSPGKTTFENCRFENCDGGFVKARIGSFSPDSEGSIYFNSNYFIKNQTISSGWIPHSEWSTDTHTMIEITSYGDNPEDNPIVFQDNTFIEESGSIRKGVETIIVDAPFASMINCHFKGLSRGVCAINIKNCIFENCNEVISIRTRLGFTSKKVCIQNSTFIDSKDVILIGFAVKEVEIQNCQFVRCHGQIIDACGVSMEYCEFYDTYCSTDESRIIEAIIQLYRPDKKEDPKNTIKKCIFDGVNVEREGIYLIHGNVMHNESIAVEIDSCEFRNCATWNEKGIIIKEDDTYWTKVFFKDVDHECITACIEDCTGLDKVNTGKSTADDYEIKKVTSSGAIIGNGSDSSNCGAPEGVIKFADFE